MTQPALPYWILPGLAALVLLIFAGALAASCFFADGTLRTQMFTTAGAAMMLALGYYFGSSAGSAKKDETIAANTVNAPQAPPGGQP